MKRSKTNQQSRTSIIVAAISALAVVIAAFVGGPYIGRLLSNSTKNLVVLVKDEKGALISGAIVTFVTPDFSIRELSDPQGIVRLEVTDDSPKNIKTIVEKNGYAYTEQDVNAVNENLVILKVPPPTAADVIMRVVDDGEGRPISNVQVVILVDTDVYPAITDSNGVARFTLKFPPTEKLSVKVSITEKQGYEINNQNLTLTPNKLQDIRLNKADNVLVVSDVETKPASAILAPPTAGPSTATLQQPASSPTAQANTATAVDGHISLNSQVKKTLQLNVTDVYTFTVDPKQLIYVVASGKNGIRMKLVDSLNNVLKDDAIQDIATISLDTGGDYMISVYGDDKTVGDYQFQVLSVSAPQTLPIKLNDIVTGRIGSIGERHIYTFTATAGQTIYTVAIVNTPGIRWTLIDPNNTVIVDETTAAESKKTLDFTGTYQMQIYSRGKEVGEYKFQLKEVAPPRERSTTIGSTVSDRIQDIGYEDVYTFPATTGQAIMITGTSVSGIRFKLISPSGTQIIDENLNSSFPVDLNSTGDYVLTIYGAGKIVGTYEFTLAQRN